MERLKNQDFDISYKPNPQLKVFEGSMQSYKNWSARAIDHISRTNYRWRQILQFAAQWPEQIYREALLATHCDGVNTWVIATKLESWLADWFSVGLYNQRIQLAGGMMEAGNGLEI